MINSRNKFSIRLFFSVFLGAGVLIYLVPITIEHMAGFSSSEDVLKFSSRSQQKVAQAGQLVGSREESATQGRVTKDHMAMLNITDHPSALQTGQEGMRQGASESSAAAAGQAGGSGGSSSSEQAASQEGVGGGQGAVPQAVSVNPPLTDDELMAGINAMKEQNQAIQKALDERSQQIEATHQAVMAAGGGGAGSDSEDINNGATGPSLPSGTGAPAEGVIANQFVVRSGGPSQ